MRLGSTRWTSRTGRSPASLRPRDRIRRRWPRDRSAPPSRMYTRLMSDSAEGARSCGAPATAGPRNSASSDACRAGTPVAASRRMRRLASLLAATVLTTGCVANTYKITNSELTRLAQTPPENRGASVRVVQDITEASVPPARPVTAETQIVVEGPGVNINVGGGTSYNRGGSVGGHSGGHGGGGGSGGDGKGLAIVVLVVAAVALVA